MSRAEQPLRVLHLHDTGAPDFTAIAADPDVRAVAPKRTFREVLAELAPGWVPDCVLVPCPDFTLLPDGIEDLPYPLIFMTADWNLRLSEVAGVMRMADGVLTDTPGLSVLERWGIAASHCYQYGWSGQFGIGPAEPVEWDVSFIGNFNHDIHAERARLLARLAKLSERYRVGLFTDVYGEDYARIVRRSRVTFNRSVRGEINIRAYEAASGGSVLFGEAENLEVGDVFPHDVASVVYRERTFEDDLAALLADRERQTVIRDEASRRVAKLTGEHWSHIAERLRSVSVTSRAWHDLPRHERLRLRALHAIGTPRLGSAALALEWIAEAHSLAQGDPQVRHGLAVCAAICGLFHGDESVRNELVRLSIHEFERLLVDWPGYALARVNFGRMLSSGGDARAEQVLSAGCLDPESIEPFSFDDFHFLTAVNRFKVDWEHAAAARDRRQAGLVVAAETRVLLAGVVLRTDPVRAEALLEEATRFDETARGWALRAEAALCRGALDRAVEAFMRSLSIQPLDFRVRARLVQALFESGRRGDAESWLRETEQIVKAFPSYTEGHQFFAALRSDLELRGGFA